MKVSEVMSVKYGTVDKDQMLSNALDIMRKKKNISRLVVLDKDKPVGVISFRDVADRLGTYKTDGISPTSLRVSSAMSFPIISIDSETEVIDAAKMMTEKKISSLLVIDGEELKGLLTKHNLLTSAIHCKKIKVKDMMTPEPKQITSSERVMAARNIMFTENYSALPVVDDEKLVGIVDDQIIADALAKLREKVPRKHQKHRLDEYYVGQVMRILPPTIDQNAPLCDLIQVFIDTQAKAVFVVDKEEQLVGILSVTDIANAIAEERI
ncbi:MAG: CBS domain-containing protein [Candidatus Heimdallarchaeota archaeon]